MLFGIESDKGDEVVWYIVPDAYGNIPRSNIYSAGARIFAFEANEKRLALVEAGRHPTGQCGFRLNDHMLKELSEIGDLEIRDADTGMLVFRRPQPLDAQRRVLHLYQQLLPPRAITSQLAPLFQYGATRIELYGHETITQLFHLTGLSSTFYSGRFLIQNYEHWMEDKYDTIIFVEDPYIAFAERLLVLSKVNQVKRPDLIMGERDSLLFGPAIEFVEQLKLHDARSVRSAFRRLPDALAPAFVDPLTRLITAKSPGEMPRSGSLAKSLDFLASCAVIGLGGHETLYADTIAELVGLERAMIPVPPRFAGLSELADMLRSQARIDHLIGKDIELFEAVKGAFGRT